MDTKTLLKFSAVSLAALAMVGCLPAEPVSEDGTSQGGDTPSAGPTKTGGGDSSKGVAAPGASRPADVIDFGAEPTGAAALSTVTCPALSMPKASPAAIVYVDANATGAETGTKAAPFRTLVKAFGSAAPGGVIYVAAGKYGEQLIVPNKDLTVLGGFAAGFGSRTDACATVFEAPNANAPVFAAPGDVTSFAIEGITVRKGVRGLMVLSNAGMHPTYTIARCVFAENGLEKEVGGAVALDGANARIFGSVFRNNRGAKGAAISAGGDVKLTIDQNVIIDNKGYSDHGGGLYISATSSKISRNTFKGNATGVGINPATGKPINGGYGGALIVYSNSLTERAKADLSFNVFTENLAGFGGAVFFDDGSIITMSHDLIYRNRGYVENGTVHGSAIYVDGTGVNEAGTSTLTAEYLTVANNNYDEKGAPTADSFGGNAYIEGWSKVRFTSSIFWNNGAAGFFVATDDRGKNELTLETSVSATSCMTGNGAELITASATICKIGAGVYLPATINFANEAADDYRETSMATMGAFSQMP